MPATAIGRSGRLRDGLGIAAGVMMVLSSAAHSLLGWTALGEQLRATHAPADLVRGLAIGWHFAGAAMLTFGCMVVLLFARRWRGTPQPTAPAGFIAVLYLASGATALVATSFDPFFMVFIIPGLLLAAAAFRPREANGTS